jgi:hypothetical protein
VLEIARELIDRAIRIRYLGVAARCDEAKADIDQGRGGQHYGNFAREDLLLQVAAQIARARPEWFSTSPPINVSQTL